MSINYLHLVETTAGELINQGNSFLILTDHEITPEKFEEMTKWNDDRIAEPLFFNFYHGLELLLKAHLLVKFDDIFQRQHKIEQLFNDFKEIFSDQNKTIEILQNYIGSNSNLVEPLKSFFIHNRITVNNFYEILKYPESRDTSIHYNYDHLKNNDKDGVIFFEQLKNDISTLRHEAVSFHRKYNFKKVV